MTALSIDDESIDLRLCAGLVVREGIESEVRETRTCGLAGSGKEVTEKRSAVVRVAELPSERLGSQFIYERLGW